MPLRRSRRDVWFIAEVSALACIALSSAAPTGLPIVDALWRGAFGLVVALAASRAGRVFTVWLAVVALAAGSESWWVLFAVVAVVLAVFDAWAGAPQRTVGAAVGGLSAVALLHITPFGFFGAPSVVAAVAVVPLVVSAYRRSRSANRKRMRVALYVGAGVVVVAVAGAAIGALSARRSGDVAVEDARRGITLLRDGKQAEAAQALADARASFADTKGWVDGLWMWPAAVLPVVGPNVNAVRTAIDSGERVAHTAQVAVESAPYGDLRLANGRIDTALITAMQQPVSNLRTAMNSAVGDLRDATSGWLVHPVARPLLSFRSQLVDVGGDVDTAAMALSALPTLLGRAGKATYLVQFTNTAETRFLGGIQGSWAVLTATDGKLTLGTADAAGTLNEKLTPAYKYIAPPDFLERYNRFRPDLFSQNWTVSPDFPTDASVARQLFEQAMKTHIDGVLMLDPEGVAALLQLTGPVKVPGVAQTLDASNAVRYLTVDQYQQYSAGQDAVRHDRLENVASAVFDALTAMQLPGYRTLADVLGPAVHGDHLLLSVTDERSQEFLDRVGLTGRFPRAEGGDLVSLRGANANPNKLDAYLRRSMKIDAVVDPRTGSVESTVTITLTNDAPATGLPFAVNGNDAGNPPGSNAMYLSLYSPLQIQGAEVDGVPRTAETQREFDMNVFSWAVVVPSRSTVTLTIRLKGVVPSVRSTGEYELTVPVQPMVNADRMEVSVRSNSSSQALTSIPVAAFGSSGMWSRRFEFNG